MVEKKATYYYETTQHTNFRGMPFFKLPDWTSKQQNQTAEPDAD